jgi:hypothetical protein
LPIPAMACLLCEKPCVGTHGIAMKGGRGRRRTGLYEPREAVWR